MLINLNLIIRKEKKNPSVGLPISPYFSALKIKWLKDNYPEINSAFEAKTCLVGTVDSWLVWVSISLNISKSTCK